MFTYGTTGSGKTHTMHGTIRNNYSTNPTDEAGTKHGGIIDMALQDIFERMTSSSQETNQIPGHFNSKFNASVSYFEVYNECVFDLLVDDRKKSPLGGLKVSENSSGVVKVIGLSEKSADDVQQVFERKITRVNISIIFPLFSHEL